MREMLNYLLFAILCLCFLNDEITKVTCQNFLSYIHISNNKCERGKVNCVAIVTSKELCSEHDGLQRRKFIVVPTLSVVMNALRNE